jgi:hypothetical protein
MYNNLFRLDPEAYNRLVEIIIAYKIYIISHVYILLYFFFDPIATTMTKVFKIVVLLLSISKETLITILIV